jgi:hypothetical protein
LLFNGHRREDAKHVLLIAQEAERHGRDTETAVLQLFCELLTPL